MNQESKVLLLSKALSKGYLTTEEIAKKVLGITRTALVYKISGKTNWSIEDLKKCRDAFDLSLKDIEKIFLA